MPRLNQTFHWEMNEIERVVFVPIKDSVDELGVYEPGICGRKIVEMDPDNFPPWVSVVNAKDANNAEINFILNTNSLED